MWPISHLLLSSSKRTEAHHRNETQLSLPCPSLTLGRGVGRGGSFTAAKDAIEVHHKSSLQTGVSQYLIAQFYWDVFLIPHRCKYNVVHFHSYLCSYPKTISTMPFLQFVKFTIFYNTFSQWSTNTGTRREHKYCQMPSLPWQSNTAARLHYPVPGSI